MTPHMKGLEMEKCQSQKTIISRSSDGSSEVKEQYFVGPVVTPELPSFGRNCRLTSVIICFLF